tara:strand:- start:2790 stop:2954 length:165 start_codon:yes stop_codon:yes gene_type:complete
MKNYKYIVWVGATPNYHLTYDTARMDFTYWVKEGYDDIKLQKIRKKGDVKCQKA